MQPLLHQGQHTFLKDPRNRCVGPVVSVTIVTSATDVSQWDGLYPNRLYLQRQTANLQTVVCRFLGYACDASHFADNETKTQ